MTSGTEIVTINPIAANSSAFQGLLDNGMATAENAAKGAHVAMASGLPIDRSATPYTCNVSSSPLLESNSSVPAKAITSTAASGKIMRYTMWKSVSTGSATSANGTRSKIKYVA
jgi:hypothetical protein